MKTIKIKVEDKDVSRLKSMLSKLDYIKIVKEVGKEEDKWVSFVSEPSLAEEWDSDEDKRYEKYITS